MKYYSIGIMVSFLSGNFSYDEISTQTFITSIFITVAISYLFLIKDPIYVLKLIQRLRSTNE